MILPIRIDGDPILREKCMPVTESHTGLKEIVEKMFITLAATPNGVGLAAPQVGWALRVFVIGGNHPNSPTPKAFINPEIVDLKGAKKKDMEGCLSVPLIFTPVERWQKVKIRYYDLDFNDHTEMFKGYDARVIQHEYDHLDGIEFYDRIPQKEQDKIMPQIEKLRQGKFPKLEYKVFRHDSHIETLSYTQL